MMTELEQRLIALLEKSQTEQTESIESLQKQVEQLSEQVMKLTEVYDDLYKPYSNWEQSS